MLLGIDSSDLLTPTVVIDRKEVLRRTGLKKSTLYGMIRAGLFPKQIQLSGGRVGWSAQEVEAWIQERMALRSDKFATTAAPPEKAKITSVATPPELSPRKSAGSSETVEASLDIKGLVRVRGRAIHGATIADPEVYKDPATGNLWLCVTRPENGLPLA
jgi:prophage regulatory protein